MSAVDKLYDFLVSNVNIEDNMAFPTWPVGKQLLYVNAEVGAALYKSYEILETDDTVDDKVITAALQQLYDRYFVPIDLPVNNFAESIAERFGRNAIPQVVAQLAGLIQSRNAS